MSKYHNRKVTLNGVTFDSAKEAKRFLELTVAENAGAIDGLRRQVPFPILDAYELNGRKVRGVTYRADFVYFMDGEMVVEDVKGYRTDVYKLKKKMFESRYGIAISEV